MLGFGNEMFMQAEAERHRERLMEDMHRVKGTHRPARLRWVQGLLDAVSKSGDPRRGAIRWESDGPIVRPTGAPHHATSH